MFSEEQRRDGRNQGNQEQTGSSSYTPKKSAYHPRIVGVSCLLSNHARKAILKWKPHSDWIITHKCGWTDTKEEFYSQLDRLTKITHRGDILLLMGDFYAQIGTINTSHEGRMGKHGSGKMTENGTGLFASNDLTVRGSLLMTLCSLKEFRGYKIRVRQRWLFNIWFHK